MRITLTEDEIREILAEAIEGKINTETVTSPDDCYFDVFNSKGEKLEIIDIAFVAEVS